MATSISDAIDDIRARAQTEAEKGRLFESLMASALKKDAVYQEQFEQVWRWSEWAREQEGFDARDTGIDLVAKNRDGGYCAIQCKLYKEDNKLAKRDIDSFFSASERDPFVSRLLIYSGMDVGIHAKDSIEKKKIPCRIIHPVQLSVELENWPLRSEEGIDKIVVKKKIFQLLSHQEKAVRDIEQGFENYDRGQLIMACGTGKTFVALRSAEKITGGGV